MRIIANYAGLTGNGGSTHYAMEDMALYSSLVNMTVCAASDPVQLRQIIEKSLYYEGPLSIRIDPGKENRVLYTAEDRFEIGKGHRAGRKGYHHHRLRRDGATRCSCTTRQRRLASVCA